MKILIFEYITGGGFNKQDLPSTLKREGGLMLSALLANFNALADVELVIMLDQRMVGQINTGAHRVVVIHQSQHSHYEFAHLMLKCDAVWPIAPECNGILQSLCKQVETAGKILLNSSSAAVALTGNKLLTYQHLRQHGIATVPTLLANCSLTNINQQLPSPNNEWIIKSIDGAGCMDSWIVGNELILPARIDKGHYIIQPHVEGKKISLSCLFKMGFAWLICINEQHFTIINQCYHLSAITVNQAIHQSNYQVLVDHIALACPGLWGYVGIDLIETLPCTWVLEINPRLTTAFVGINAALGINIADNVLHLLTGLPHLIAQHNTPVTIITNQEEPSGTP